ncbi:hypothetical protein [Haloferula sp.]|uniref:hypothetical protein n=1 Tax=Haloferula sp. TaxID=2497595 RepID=UPI00329FF933
MHYPPTVARVSPVFRALTRRAREEASSGSPRENLQPLIRFALAAGRVDRLEMRSLEQDASKIRIGKPELSSLIVQAQEG